MSSFKHLMKRWLGNQNCTQRLTYPAEDTTAQHMTVDPQDESDAGSGREGEEDQPATAEYDLESDLRACSAVLSLAAPSPTSARAEALSKKYWNDGKLSSEDQICDGFYDVNGEFPELGSSDAFPYFEFLCQFEPDFCDSREVVVVNGEKDDELRGVEMEASQAFFAACPQGMVAAASAVARVVAAHMGGPAMHDGELYPFWSSASARLKLALHSTHDGALGPGGLLVPIGRVRPGLSRHRALLFKYLADTLCIPCQLLRARDCGVSGDLLSMIVLLIDGSEFLLDLMQKPGNMVTPEDWFAGEGSLDGGGRSGPGGVAPVPGGEQGSPLAAQRYLRDPEGLSSPGSVQDGPEEIRYSEAKNAAGSRGAAEGSGPSQQDSHPPGAPRAWAELRIAEAPLQDLIDLTSPSPAAMAKRAAARDVAHAGPRFQPTVRPLSPLRNRAPAGVEASGDKGAAQVGRGSQASIIRRDSLSEQGHLDLPADNIQQDVESSSSSTDEDTDGAHEESTQGHRVWEPITDCLIDMHEVQMMQRLGVGSYGEVYRAEWQGTEVAVKLFLEQQMTDAVQAEFLQEVRIMKELRHPNIVQFMGATWKPHGIVMQYMHRGSLFRILHRNAKGKRLHLHRRLRMALDVALGMRYLHSRKPMIVHRDLKSPNLLVARDWTVRLCDFGLSKLKSNTFLSTRSTGGTPEWMAPEVLRNDRANEKSDVYSFAVIMWELMFCREPWQGTMPMQVVFLVGNNGKRLPLDWESPLNSLIEDCWQEDALRRPTFDEIYRRLKEVQCPINSNFEEDSTSSGGAPTAPSES